MAYCPNVGAADTHV